MTKTQKRTTQKAYDKRMAQWEFILDMEGTDFTTEFYSNLYEAISEQAAQDTGLYGTFTKSRRYNSWFCK